MTHTEKAPLIHSHEALKYNSAMVALAHDLLLMKTAATDPVFKKTWAELLDIYAQFQQQVITDNKLTVACARGCAFCCSHWVEDVYSFETALIADHLRAHLSIQEREELRSRLIADEAALIELQGIMDEKLAHVNNAQLSDIDRDELLLATYYQLNRCCPLIGDTGSCTVYSLRPFTCRAYYNFSKAHYCLPEFINDTDGSPTYLLEPEEDVSTLLDELHALHNTTGKTGLRSALADLLAD